MTLDERNHFAGMASLLLNSVLLSVVLLWLRDRPNDSGLQVLALGNLILGMGALIPTRRVISLPRPDFKMIALWSLCYCCTYYSFVRWPHLLPLSLLRIAQALAPTAAVFSTGDWKKSKGSPLEIAISLLPLGLLIYFALLQQQTLLTGSGAALFVVVSACYFGSQSAARILSKDCPGFWISMHLSLLNGVLLTIWVLEPVS